MSKNADLAAILIASAKLEESGKLDRILSIFDADPIVTVATAKPHHRATANKPGKVIVRNPRQSMRDTMVTVAEPIAPEAGINAEPSIAAAPKAPKRTRKAPAKASKPAAKQGRTLDTTPGSMTNGQEKRIRNVAAEHGKRIRIIATWSMADASAYYAKLVKSVA